MKAKEYKIKNLVLFAFMACTVLVSCNEAERLITGTPEVSVLLLPENNQACEIGEVIDDRATVTFNWQEAGKTKVYDLIITNLITQEINPNFNLEGTSVDVLLKRGYPYSWKVSTKNAGNTVTESETWKFYLSGDGETNTVPFPVQLISPKSGVTVTPDNGNVTLEWGESSDIDGDDITYTVYLDKIDGNQDPLDSWKNLTSNSITLPVDADSIYYWHVETTDGNNTAISTTYTFKTEN